MTDKYQAIKEKFKAGDWVKGTNKHEGCSQVFDMDSERPQPFDYLNETDPNEFRLATGDEVKKTYPDLNKDDLTAAYTRAGE
ncbi:hypothetical protein [Endozoicomonas ascidiicola]|uniref:hypothetical protein n=1 Tax=Endozoicomonas ascidiicola TaxID=1698521 RepID=UPI000835E97F|nr:hypothetical protein [Endozoicomonas ascidiicola]